MKRSEDPVGEKLFELAELTLDDALAPDANPQDRLETLKIVAQLYIGHKRVTRGTPLDDPNATTFDKLIERVNSVQGDEE